MKTMGVFQIITMILLLVMGVFLVVAVLMQHGKGKLSSTITGGADTYFGNEGGDKKDKLLARVTTIVGIVFVLVAIIAYVIQPDYALYPVGDEWQEYSTYFENFAK